jgi:signal-transduction protein with cAMP-binding, CBS, and nucleotidyltransferase domain
MPLFTAARVLSIRHDVRARSSAERVQGAAVAAGAEPDLVAQIVDAQACLLGAVIGQQLVDGGAGLPPTPRVVPASLSKPEQERLRAALKVVGSAVDLASEGRI